MTRWLLWLFAGIVLGGLVHLASILLLPRIASQDAFSRLTPIAPVNAIAAIAEPTPEQSVMPFMDPAFAVAVCRYDIEQAPLRLTAPIAGAYTSVSFYTRNGVAYYAINDRAAGRTSIELELMTADQRAQLPDDDEVTAADRLIVESPTLTGLIVLRALAPEPDQMQAARQSLARARCGPDPKAIEQQSGDAAPQNGSPG